MSRPETVKAGAVGQRFNRVDGRLKTTGKATFAAEYKLSGVAYGALVFSNIARGKIKNLETRAAETAAGVITVLTHKNAPQMKKPKIFDSGEDAGAASSSILYLNTDEV